TPRAPPWWRWPGARSDPALPAADLRPPNHWNGLPTCCERRRGNPCAPIARQGLGIESELHSPPHNTSSRVTMRDWLMPVSASCDVLPPVVDASNQNGTENRPLSIRPPLRLPTTSSPSALH